MKNLTTGFIFLLAVVGLPSISAAVIGEPVPVPEPATALLLAAGGFGVFSLARRKRS
jgi:hypothetical protein